MSEPMDVGGVRGRVLFVYTRNYVIAAYLSLSSVSMLSQSYVKVDCRKRLL